MRRDALPLIAPYDPQGHSALRGGSARKFALDNVIPRIRALFGKRFLVQSRFFRRLNAGLAVGALCRLGDARLQAWIVREDVFDVEALALDGKYPGAAASL